MVPLETPASSAMLAMVVACIPRFLMLVKVASRSSWRLMSLIDLSPMMHSLHSRLLLPFLRHDAKNSPSFGENLVRGTGYNLTFLADGIIYWPFGQYCGSAAKYKQV